MKKFIIHTRSIPGVKTTAPTIIEIECELISVLEDPSTMWMPKGEFKARILGPKWLYEPKGVSEKDKIMVPPVYHSHSVYQTLGLAEVAAKVLIRSEFDFALRKKNVAFTEEDVEAKFAEVQVIML